MMRHIVSERLVALIVIVVALPQCLAMFANVALAQVPSSPAEAKPALNSPVLHDDGRVTMNLRAAKAARVLISSGELTALVGAEALKMARDDDGVWSATFGPVPPGIYDYAFDVDGVRVTDPLSTHVMGNRTGSRGYLEVPGPEGKPRIDQWRDVPHGTVTQHWYDSKTTGTRRSVHVYVPPMPAGWTGFPAVEKEGEAQSARLPVVYLLHGSGDDDRHWSALGQANVIADNLIAEKKMVPAVIVMPDGHPAGKTPDLPRDSEERLKFFDRNRELFARDLLEDVMPLVESHYPVRKDAAGRAIVGLSMGGGQSLDVGLAHIDQFAWIGAFSSGGRRLEEAAAPLTADPKRANRQIRLLWIACGVDDRLLDQNEALHAKLNELGIKHTYLKTPGSHTWTVWRGYLADFLPLVFR